MLILPQESALRGSMDEKPQLIGPLQLCFNLKKNGAYIGVDQSVETELTSLATELLGTPVGIERKRVKGRLRNKLLSICDGWTVRKGKMYLRDYPKPKKAEPVQTLQSAGNGEGNANINNFIDIVFSPPWRGTVPTGEGYDEWRNQLFELLQNMNVQDRDIACQRLPSPLRVELVKRAIREEHLSFLNGTNIGKHDISNWYAIPIKIQEPCNFCVASQYICSWSRGPDESRRCRECILTGRKRCFIKIVETTSSSHSTRKKQSKTSDDSEYKGRISAEDALPLLPTTRRADKEILDVVGTTVGQKRPGSPLVDSSQPMKRQRTDESDAASANTPKTLVMDDGRFQDRVTERILQLENVVKEIQKENEELWRANDSLKVVIESTLKKLECLQADVTHAESILRTMR